MPSTPSSTLTLSPFALQPGGPVRELHVQVMRSESGALRFVYTLHADLSRIRLPARTVSQPADGLWKHTCFEAFIAPDGAGGGYRELNFSPSTEWAVYSFSGYREGMAPVVMAPAPQIRVEAASSLLTVDARLGTLAPVASAKLRIALAAVIEDDSGTLSYWALKHAPTKPDFHHAAGFILEV